MREDESDKNFEVLRNNLAQAPGQAGGIFSAVYEQLKPEDSGEAMKTAGKFIDNLERGVKEHIDPILESGETNQAIYAGIENKFNQTVQETLVLRYLRDKWYANKQAGGAEFEWAKTLAYDSQGKLKEEWWTSQDASDFFQARVTELAMQNAFRDDGALKAFIKDRPDLISQFRDEQAHARGISQRVAEAANGLVASGDVNPLTAKVFLKALPWLKPIGDYNAVVRNRAISSDDLAKQNERYYPVVDEIWQRQSEATKHEQGGYFYHFNSHLMTDEGQQAKNRIYISADLAKAPQEVVKAWMASLDETGLKDKICFKIPAGLVPRFESIVMYQTDKTSESDIEKLLTAFARNCPAELLNQKDMPSGIPLRRGVSMAPEPANINTFRQCYGSLEDISYNELISGLTKLAFEMSFHEAKKAGVVNPLPHALKGRAAIYFNQFVRLAGINPDTMIPNSQGGKLPQWAQNIAA